MKDLSVHIASMHFSDIHSDRLIDLTYSESVALAEHVEPYIKECVTDALREAQRSIMTEAKLTKASESFSTGMEFAAILLRARVAELRANG